MKKYLLLTLFALFATASFAQELNLKDFKINKLRLEVRTDFDYLTENDSSFSGFSGRYLNFVISGDITKDFFYAYRQRLNKVQSDNNFFDATDYLYIGWRINKNFSLTVGKEVIAMGGIEYDLAPIDVYFHSLFWSNFNCYRFGTNFIYTSNDEKNIITFQLTNSPFISKLYDKLYNYSLHWRGNFKHFGPVCSVNMYEYKEGTFLNVIALGTTYQFGPIVGYLDFTNRANGDQKEFFFKDMTYIARLGCNFFGEKLHVFVKAGRDVNEAKEFNITENQLFDLCVLPGSDVQFYGGGFEFFPLKGRDDIRIHAFFAVNDTSKCTELNNGLLTLTTKNGTSYQANFGITWKLNFIDR